ncbi:MAG: TOTE conflict system archaeo-eukaryotic primase domain-containing protein, partial [Coriobacteriales bacterium]
MPADQHLPAIIARLESLEERVATLEQLLADANALHKSLSLPLDGCAEGEALTAPARPEEGHRAAPGFVDAEELSSYPFLGTGERLQLFMRLFAHRRDRYAQRWVSKAGRTGYSPACDNKGKPSLCNLKAGCSNCVNRAYSTLDEKHVTNHLDPRVEQRHRETIGAYPLDSQNNTMFLAIDLDHGEWSPAAQALMASFAELSVSAYCERSRSGDGAHIWVFFQEPVPAKKARNLGTLALTHAMERSKAFSFSCYDRLFPNQDTLPA